VVCSIISINFARDKAVIRFGQTGEKVVESLYAGGCELFYIVRDHAGHETYHPSQVMMALHEASAGTNWLELSQRAPLFDSAWVYAHPTIRLVVS